MGVPGAAGSADLKPPERAGPSVAILARVFQFILWLILATWLGRKLLGWLFGSGANLRSASPRAPQRLQRDPVCGTYVSPEISHTLEHDGVVHHFCSAECRAKFQSAQPRPARSDHIGVSA